MKKVSHTPSHNAVSAMKTAVVTIDSHVKFATWEEFNDSSLIRDAVYFQLSIISEAIHEVDKVYLDKYDYPWYQLKTFRKLMFNDKFHIRKPAVWHLIKEGLPELERTLNLLLGNEFSDGRKN